MNIGDKVIPIKNYPDIPEHWEELEIIRDFNIDKHWLALFEFKVKV